MTDAKRNGTHKRDERMNDQDYINRCVQEIFPKVISEKLLKFPNIF